MSRFSREYVNVGEWAAQLDKQVERIAELEADNKELEAALELGRQALKASIDDDNAKLERLEARCAAMREALERAVDLLEGTVRPEFAESASERTMAPRIRAFLEELEQSSPLSPTVGHDWEQRIRVEERERCARVAEAGHRDEWSPRGIAAAIRALGDS